MGKEVVNEDNNIHDIRQINLTLSNGSSVTLISSNKQEDMEYLVITALKMLKDIKPVNNGQLQPEVE